MSLADFAGVIETKIVIDKFKDVNGDPIEVTIRPLTLKKARMIVENYGIFVEELILKKIDPDKIDNLEYVRNFGMDKFDEAISYIIAVALDSEDQIEFIQTDMPWHNKIEIFIEILELSLPEDKKKAQESMGKFMEMVGQPLLMILNK
jgi:hypothetical protein